MEKRILIIDDEQFFLDMLGDILSKRGYKIDKAISFESGIEQLKNNDYEIIFLDASLKNVSGTTGIAKIKETKSNADIVVITSLDDTSLAHDFLKAGAVDVVLKPYKTEDLEFVIERILKRKNIESERELLLFENIEFIELLSLHRKIAKLLTFWEYDRLKDALLDEIMECTLGQGALYYSLPNYDEKFFVCEHYKGIVDSLLPKQKISKESIENAELSFFIKPKELNIPLKLDEKYYGVIKVVEPFLQDGFGEKEFNKAYLISEFIPYALENAKKIELLQRCAVKDEKTHAYYWDILKDFVKKEINKAIRYDRKLAIIGINIENLKEVRRSYGEQAVKDGVIEITNTINSVIRDSDWFVETKDGEYLIFLTETDYFGAIMTIRRIRQALIGKGLIKGSREVGELIVNMAAVALLVNGASLEELLRVLRARLILSRNSLYHKIDFHKKDFNHICSEILKIEPDNQWKGVGIYYWFDCQIKHFYEILSLFCKDVKINNKRRGVFYAGTFDGKRIDFIKDRQDFSDLNTKIYFFFSEDKDGFEQPGIVNVSSKEKQESVNFILYLNEHYSYMCIEREGKYFESSDTLLVEALINKLQIEYYLQWQL